MLLARRPEGTRSLTCHCLVVSAGLASGKRQARRQKHEQSGVNASACSQNTQWPRAVTTVNRQSGILRLRNW